MHRNGCERQSPRRALAACRGAFLTVAVFSAIVNVLMLTGAVFMLEVYDRVLPSRSVPTLVGIAVLAGVLFFAQGVLEFFRTRILARIGQAVDEGISARVFQAAIRLPLILGPKGETSAPLRDLDTVRAFLASSGPAALFDLPWIPFYLLIIYAFHPLLGFLALAGGLLLVALTVAAELMTRAPAKAGSAAGLKRSTFADTSRRNAEVVTAMGMGSRLAGVWQGANREYLDRNRQASDVAGSIGAASRTFRFVLQSAILGLGAWLVIHNEATSGIIIAGSILFGRALAPVDGAIANAKGFVSARQSWHNLNRLMDALPATTDPLALPDPLARLSVANVTVVAPGGQKPLVHEASFEIPAGKAVGVIGPSGSGKSCLVRALVGAWKPARGSVQLDGAALDQWSEEAISRHIGYLPQDVELFAGTVADNIARFDPHADPGAIVAAAKAAGVHDLITALPDGYQTEIGDQGAALSAGQRQRVALARALFGNPFLVVLDEPNSNLDAEGEQALLKAVEGVKARGGIVVVVAHRPNVLAAVDFVLAMQGGRCSQLVPRDTMVPPKPADGPPAIVAAAASAFQRRTAAPHSEPSALKPRLRVATAHPVSIEPAE